uniref:Ribonuclease H-like domain-containing protein n=1 Tax=Tanacetum cinerariifolium TaxID=118510 RepID=A0A699J2A4_TANCI|nr:ribonuclease H-like domain-containing protein [Tanacetum cinerariifolium]
MHSVTSASAHPDTPPQHNTSQSTTQYMTQPNFAHTTPTSAITHTIPNPPTRTYPMVTHPNLRDAMYDKYNALIKNSTWVLVLKPPNINMVWSMWLFRHKCHADGSLSSTKRSTSGYCVFLGDNLLLCSSGRNISRLNVVRDMVARGQVRVLRVPSRYHSGRNISRLNVVRDIVARGQVRVLRVPSRYQYANIFTK